MRIQAPDQTARAAVLDRATTLDLTLSAGRIRAEASGPTASASEIWRAAALADPAALTKVQAAAAVDPAIARAFHAALSEHALAAFPALRAADSGMVEARRDPRGGWEISLTRSKKTRGRCFLDIAVPEGSVAPAFLFAAIGEAYAATPLPVPEDGVIQLVLDEADLIVAAYLDRRATLLLR